MKFVEIPAGTFVMGSPKTEPGHTGDEQQHVVTLSKSFELSVYPVTQEQWVAVMGNNPSSTVVQQFYIFVMTLLKRTDVVNALAPVGPIYCPHDDKIKDQEAVCPNNPVDRVSWNDVQKFITMINTMGEAK